MEPAQFKEFLQRLGFDENPFAKTNSANEERLEKYFVRPKYFASLQGDPQQPESVFVFAPRGSGKTAQKIMLEREAPDAAILPVSYDYFPIPDGASEETFSVNYHLTNVLRQATLSLAAYLIRYEVPASTLTDEVRGQLKLLVRKYVGSSSIEAVDSFSSSLLGRTEKFVEFWNKWSKVGTAVVTPLLKWLGIDGAGVPDLPQGTVEAEKESLQHWDLLKRVCKALHFKSIHVLIDRVDETSWTGNDAEKSYLLVKSLVRTLPLLDDPFVGWKFFLWDRLDAHCRADARPDRVKQFRLEWSDRELKEMLSQRCRAFSNNHVPTFWSTVEDKSASLAEDACIIFANGSPRNVIRLCHSVLAEQVELDASSSKISEDGLDRGITTFCSQSLPESFPEEQIKQIRRTGRTSFTISELANNVFRENQVSTGNRIRSWQESGLVAQNGTIKLRKSAGKPSNYYRINDTRAIRAHNAGHEPPLVDEGEGVRLYALQESNLLRTGGSRRSISLPVLR